LTCIQTETGENKPYL